MCLSGVFFTEFDTEALQISSRGCVCVMISYDSNSAVCDESHPGHEVFFILSQAPTAPFLVGTLLPRRLILQSLVSEYVDD